MKLMVDLQGSQSPGSGKRGIGRYSRALVEALARRAGTHELLVALNDVFPDTIEPLRGALSSLLPSENVLCWKSLTGIAAWDPLNLEKRRAGKILHDSFFAAHKPDVVHISSFFDGWGDDVVTSIGPLVDGAATAVTFYDLIPLIHEKIYLADSNYKSWYHGKLKALGKAGLLLAISESSRHEAIDLLKFPPDRVVNISSAVGSHFQPIDLSEEKALALRNQYGLHRSFVMYTGGIDHRKNIEGLISAFATLPADIRARHQLAIVCSANIESIAALRGHAKRHGLGEDDLVMTGFVPDDDLVALYNLCTAFCLPSLHEGFGLPVLEAMQCGAPTIGSNLSSVPEVIGRKDALFDPRIEKDIAARLHQVLTDHDYRRDLARHGLEQAKKFSWDETARRAWSAFEDQNERLSVTDKTISIGPSKKRKKLAYLSPLPPERSGIADYSAEMLPALSEFYEISVVVDQGPIADSWVNDNCSIQTVDWFNENGHCFDRIIYQFGNSPFHSHMFDLLGKYPGVVVLHDFYLSGVISYMNTEKPGFWDKYLYASHGYPALFEKYVSGGASKARRDWPANIPVLQNAIGVIVHSEFSKKLAQHFYDGKISENWRVVNLARTFPPLLDKSAIRSGLGFEESDFLVCSFGMMAPTKQNDSLLQAWHKSSLSSRKECHLIFVGSEEEGDFGKSIRSFIKNEKVKNVRITGYVSPELYKKYLNIADMAVQLRTQSRGETSAAVVDCMAHGVPTIVNQNGSMSEIPEKCVVKIPDEYSIDELVSTLERLYSDHNRRLILSKSSRQYVRDELSPSIIAEKYYKSVEHFYSTSAGSVVRCAINALADLDLSLEDNELWHVMARAIAFNIPKRCPQKQLFIDISELVQRDSRSGVQRVVRSILKELMDNPPDGFRIEPVYAFGDSNGYRYARNYTLQMMGCPSGLLHDEFISFDRGDIFLGLDLQHYIVRNQSRKLSEMSERGVRIHFIVYDLLPILLEHHFLAEARAAELHHNWLMAIGECADTLICISEAVADELNEWISKNPLARSRPLAVKAFHLGADIESSSPSKGIPADGGKVLAEIKQYTSFLMVGTLEPRKGYAQSLEAFEGLWAQGYDVSLVMVGQQGWMTGALVNKITKHPEFGKRLFWLSGISDEYLEKIYAACDCLIAASEGEGFGLPLIEAAQHKLPIIARDIPVFREVAGNHAFYFSGLTANELRDSIKNWLQMKHENKHPRSHEMPWLTWKQSTQQLLDIILK